MLERAKEATRNGRYTRIEYARFADDLVILVDGCYQKCGWLVKAVYQRLLEELGKLDVQINSDKTRQVDLTKLPTLSLNLHEDLSITLTCGAATVHEPEAALDTQGNSRGG